MPQTKELEGRVAVITGASRGLGRAMAIALAEAGAKVVLAARDREKLQESAALVKQAGGEASVHPMDVTREDEVAELAADVKQRYGHADILINNAGMNLRKPITDFTLDEWNRVIDTNLTSVFLMCRAFVPLMKGRGYGRIINMTSIMSHISLPERTAYSSAKAGLLGFIRALALELAPEKISVIGISPGVFDTEMNQAAKNDPAKYAAFTARIAAGEWGKPEDVGALARYLCSDAAAYITGQDIVIDGGCIVQF